MKQSIVHVALVVRDYDEAIEFYTKKLHFTLVEDTYQPEQDKRWVVVSPPGSVGTTLLLARLQNRNRNLLLAINLAGEYFCFSTRMTFGEISTRWSQGESNLCASPGARVMAQLPSLKTCMEIYGICWN